MVNWGSKRLGDYLWLANGIVLVVLVNLLASGYFYRVDLTEEKRYSIKAPTKEVLENLDDDVYIEVFLEGELNAEFRRFKKAIAETLEEFRIYSHDRVKYVFTDPALAMSQKAQNEFIQELAQKGITATNVIDREEGQTSAKLIFPGAVISYSGFETGVNLLKGNKAQNPEEEINQSIEGVEFELANAIYKLTNNDRKRIGFLMGHGELDSLDIAGLNNALLEQYDVRKVDLTKTQSLERYQALLMAKPTKAFTEEEKYKLDQYIMGGGKMLFLLDKLNANMDSASREDYIALPVDLNLDDQFFKYGIRINYDLIQDKSAAMYPIITGENDGRPQIQLVDWPFFPLINHYSNHPITRNLDAVITRFISTIDTVKSPGVAKTPLMFTSPYSRTIAAPVNVGVRSVFSNRDASEFTPGNMAVAYLLEGNFTSLYKNRFLPNAVDKDKFLEKSLSTKMIVISDGDLARNNINLRTGQPQPLGFDPPSNYTFANQDFLLNAMAYLTNENGLINARNKIVKIRPLNKVKVKNEEIKWQIVNLILPLLIIILYGIGRAMLRKRKFARF